MIFINNQHLNYFLKLKEFKTNIYLNKEIHLAYTNNKSYSSLCKMLESIDIASLEKELNLCISLANLKNMSNQAKRYKDKSNLRKY